MIPDFKEIHEDSAHHTNEKGKKANSCSLLTYSSRN